jgi:hypothetical protein
MYFTFTLSDNSSVQLETDKTHIIIGRGQSCDLRVVDEGLSRRHALFEITDEGYFVTDLESSNGVFIDNQRLRPNQRTPFPSYLPLRLGQVKLQIEDNSGAVPDKLMPKKIVPAIKTSEKIIRPAPRLHSETTIKNQPKKSYAFPVAAGALIALAVVLQFFYGPEIAVNKSIVSPQVQSKFAHIQNEFLKPEEYKETLSMANCLDFESICKDLKLTTRLMEGVVLKDDEAYILMNLKKFQDQKGYKIKDPRYGVTALAILDLFQSNFFSQLETEQLGQIHLILQNDSDSSYSVYRFYFHPYHPDFKLRHQLRRLLINAVLDGKPELIDIDKSIPSLVFPI